MDVDSNSDAQESSGLKRAGPSASSSSGQKRPRLALLENELLSLKEGMAEHSEARLWGMRSANCETRGQWQNLFADVLYHLAKELAGTNMEIVPFATPEDASKMVLKFDESHWKGGVTKGIEERDWEDLIEHRMYHSTQIGVCLIFLTTVILATQLKKRTRQRAPSPSTTNPIRCG
jgi:hypothetical protein